MPYTKQTSASPATKVSYFKQFPFFFIRPYDEQEKLGDAEYLQKLIPGNCEWLLRPKIAMSESCQALRKNWETASAGSMLDGDLKQRLERLMAPMAQTMANLDNKDKSTKASNQDVFNIMNWCFEDPELDASLSCLLHESAAFYVFITHLRTMRSLLTNPEQYAAKITNDAPDAIEFRTLKTMQSMQKMLTSMCASGATSQTGQPAVARRLANELINPQASTAQGTAQPIQPTLPRSTGLVPPPSTVPANTAPANPAPANPAPANPTPAINNQAMDVLLQMQAQMQAMQQQIIDQQQAINASKTPQAPLRRKRAAPQPAAEVNEDPDETPSAAQQEDQTPNEEENTNNDEEEPVEPPKRKRNKKNKKKQNEGQ